MTLKQSHRSMTTASTACMTSASIDARQAVHPAQYHAYQCHARAHDEAAHSHQQHTCSSETSCSCSEPDVDASCSSSDPDFDACATQPLIHEEVSINLRRVWQRFCNDGSILVSSRSVAFLLLYALVSTLMLLHAYLSKTSSFIVPPALSNLSSLRSMPTLVVANSESSKSEGTLSTRLSPAAHAEGVLHFLVLSDLHLDLHFDSAIRPDHNGLCRASKGDCQSSFDQWNARDFSAAHSTSHFSFGRYLCDPPHHFLNESLSALSVQLHELDNTPSVVLVLGDLTAHFPVCEEEHLYAFNETLSLIRHAFPHAELVFSIGNGDVVPAGYIALNEPSRSQAAELTTASSQAQQHECNSQFAALLQRLMHRGAIRERSQQRSFCAGGYYATRLHASRIRILSINTLIWASDLLTDSTVASFLPLKNGAITPLSCTSLLRDSDPLAQFEWLRVQLHEAQLEHERVLIVGHQPPGMKLDAPSWCKQHLQPFRQLLNTFDSLLIMGLMFGDYSEDLIRLLHDDKGRAQHAIHIHAGMTPRKNANPVARLWHVQSSEARFLDYDQYMVDLLEANMRGRVEWRHEYALLSRYSMESYTLDSIVTFIDSLFKQPSLLKHYASDINARKPGALEPLDAACDARFEDEAENLQCKLTGSERAHNAHARLHKHESSATSNT